MNLLGYAATSVVALATIGATLPASVAGAPGANEAYLDVRLAKASLVSTPGPNDLTRGEVEVDPNSGMVNVVIHISRDPGQWVRRAITTLGVKNASGTCQPAVEVVSSNASYNYDTVVRRPGETTLPKEQDEIYIGSVLNGSRTHVPLLDGLEPDCGKIEVTNANGVVLTTTQLGTFTRQPVTEVSLTVGKDEYTNPEQIPLNRTEEFSLLVSTSGSKRAYDGRITIQAPDGVTVKPHGSPDGVIFDGSGYHHFRFDITVAEPGWKQVTLRADAGNADPVSHTFKVYGVGGRPPVATGSLAGRKFASRTSWYDEVNGYNYPLRQSVWFLNDRFAYVGVPPQGKPTCTAANVKSSSYTGCKRYWWNKESNVLQIGTWIGSVHGRTLRYYLPRSGRAYDFTHPFGTAPAGKRYQGRWSDVISSDYDSLKVFLTLRRDGTFVLKVDAYAASSTTRGRYRIDANGRLTLRYRSGKTGVRTLGIGRSKTGQLTPSAGLFLSLPKLPRPTTKAAWLTPVR